MDLLAVEGLLHWVVEEVSRNTIDLVGVDVSFKVSAWGNHYLEGRADDSSDLKGPDFLGKEDSVHCRHLEVCDHDIKTVVFLMKKFHSWLSVEGGLHMNNTLYP